MNQTSTREGFESATTTYWSSVEYDVEEIQVMATSPVLDSSDDTIRVPCPARVWNIR